MNKTKKGPSVVPSRKRKGPLTAVMQLARQGGIPMEQFSRQAPAWVQKTLGASDAWKLFYLETISDSITSFDALENTAINGVKYLKDIILTANSPFKAQFFLVEGENGITFTDSGGTGSGSLDSLWNAAIGGVTSSEKQAITGNRLAEEQADGYDGLALTQKWTLKFQLQLGPYLAKWIQSQEKPFMDSSTERTKLGLYLLIQAPASLGIQTMQIDWLVLVLGQQISGLPTLKPGLGNLKGIRVVKPT